MMETEEKYKVVIVDDERTAIDALRRELEPYREFEVKGIAGNGAKGKKMIMELQSDRDHGTCINAGSSYHIRIISGCADGKSKPCI